MRVKVWVRLNLVGCRSEREIDIPDEDLCDLPKSQQIKLIESYCLDEIWEMAEWGWRDREDPPDGSK